VTFQLFFFKIMTKNAADADRWRVVDVLASELGDVIVQHDAV